MSFDYEDICRRVYEELQRKKSLSVGDFPNFDRFREYFYVEPKRSETHCTVDLFHLSDELYPPFETTCRFRKDDKDLLDRHNPLIKVDFSWGPAMWTDEVPWKDLVVDTDNTEDEIARAEIFDLGDVITALRAKEEDEVGGKRARDEVARESALTKS